MRRTVRPLEPGASLTVSSDLLADILPGTGAVSVSVSPLAALDVPGLLQALDRYPYGCSEQIVSRALPLLYVNRLAATEALALDDKADERVRDAIERVLPRQDFERLLRPLVASAATTSGSTPTSTDFLTRARERNFAVPQRAFNLALDRLRNFVANTTEVEENGADLAYAAYVLARNGRPVMGDLRYLADTKIARLHDAAGARPDRARRSALLGDRGRAQSAFAAAVEQLRGDARRRRLSRRLRLAPARRRRHAGARLRGRHRARGDRSRSRSVIEEERALEPPHQHAGERLDGARRPGARRATPRRSRSRSTARRARARSTAPSGPGDARARRR